MAHLPAANLFTLIYSYTLRPLLCFDCIDYHSPGGVVYGSLYKNLRRVSFEKENKGHDDSRSQKQKT